MEALEKSEEDNMSTSTKTDLQVGSMRINKPRFKVLLVFPKKSEQCQAWRTTLDKLGFENHLEHDSEQALEKFQKEHHHLVVIEIQRSSVDAQSMCRSLRGMHLGSFTTVVALLPRRNQIGDSPSTRDLLHVGFDRLLPSKINRRDIEDELLQLEAGPLTLQLKYRACQAVFLALEKSRDLIQITDENFSIQYVNKMYERMTGISAKEAVGSNLSSYFDNEKNDKNAWEKIRDEIQSGHECHGLFYTKRKQGEDNQFYVLILPTTGKDEKVHQHVVLSRLPESNSIVSDLSHLIGMKSKNPSDLHRKHSGDQPLSRRPSATSLFGDSDSAHRRANSLARIHSMAIEAPITQIINRIRKIRDSSQPSVSEVLDQVLDILRNSELYSPADLPNRSRDPMLSDFVEGLVTGSGYSHRRASGGTSENLLGKTQPSGALKHQPAPGHHLASVMNADPHIARCLENFNSWDYDVLALERVTVKKPLVHLGMHLLNRFDTCDVLSCTPTTLHSWLVAIEANYHSCNPYHNSTHAADVMHATAYFLRKERVKAWMEPLDEVAALLAAIIHDVDHPGRTNAFLINSNNPLALLYNDTAVLESHHAAFAFKFTVNSENCNIFKNLSKDNFRNIRQSIIDMVLATEMSKHFEHVNKFISIVTKNNNNNSCSLDQEGSSGGNCHVTAATNPVITHELKTLVKRVMIKVADVINPARKTPICVEWARRISEEYFTQTDEEKRLGLPVVMPHFDRNTCSMPKSQTTFINYFLMDMFEAWHEFCGIEECMKNLNENYNYWQNLQDKGIMRLAELEDESCSNEDANLDGTPKPTSLARTNEVKGLSLKMENHLS